MGDSHNVCDLRLMLSVELESVVCVTFYRLAGKCNNDPLIFENGHLVVVVLFAFKRETNFCTYIQICLLG